MTITEATNLALSYYNYYKLPKTPQLITELVRVLINKWCIP